MTSNNNPTLHEEFTQSKRPHILQITNHGIHQWNVIPGLPDTGGQNVFVNQMTDTLVDLGFRVTICNRGGFNHPKTGVLHTGLDYKDAHNRILYLEDQTKAFVRKEDMDEQLPQLKTFLLDFLNAENTPIDLICSHYWDAAKLGLLVNNELSKKVKHVWVPHSLGALKKRNVDPKEWDNLRIDERIAVEKEIIPQLDALAATSSSIRDTMKNDYDYDCDLFLPPCVQAHRYHPREVAADDPIYTFLSEHSGLKPEEIRECQIVTEISRTDTTKQKDVLIKAFAKIHAKLPKTMLAVSIDKNAPELYEELTGLINELGIRSHVAVLGNCWEQLPPLYAITNVYCSPSVMEGFGMSVQEAAATSVPVVGSHLIPFVQEFLLGENVEMIEYEGMLENPLQQGQGAFLVQARDVEGFALAIGKLLEDQAFQKEMGQKAYDITIPYFTWSDMVKRFMQTIDFPLP